MINSSQLTYNGFYIIPVFGNICINLSIHYKFEDFVVKFIRKIKPFLH